jgi:hypothetical protein
MALTVYTAQVVAIWVLGTLDYVDNTAWSAYVLASLVFATAWRLLLGRGPLERLLTRSSSRVAGLLPAPGIAASQSASAR